MPDAGARVAVTGANGFLAASLIPRLLEAGFRVTAADHRSSPWLTDLPVDFVPVDVLDENSLRAAFEGAEFVVHLAAVVFITRDATGAAWRVNVDGPRNAARVALECGVRRFVHCSSVHAFDLETCGPILNESGPRAVDARLPAYDRSKYAGEREILKAVDGGLDAVIVNPTGVIGPFDSRPSLMGETILQLRDGRIPVNVGGGFDFVDVRDVASGLLAAMDRGCTGESYLLSGTRVSMKELGQLVAKTAGVQAPRFDVPLPLVSWLAPLVERLTPLHRAPLFTPDALHALRYSPAVSHYKATTELGYAPRPLNQTITDTLAWFDAHRLQPDPAVPIAGRAPGHLPRGVR